MVGPLFRIFSASYITGCDSSDPVLKVDLNGAWKLHIQSRHTIQNIVVSHGRFVNCFIINSNETPHILDRRFENRIKITRSSLGNALDILVTNATSEDGGTYSVHVTTDHVTFTKCYSLYVMGKCLCH